MDADITAFNQKDERLSRMIEYFTILAIFVACKGLPALAAYVGERRTKEFGIQKVLGATMASLVTLLSKDFVKLVLVANLLTWPAAWLARSTWLQNFAYRIEIGWDVFLLADGLALLIALTTKNSTIRKCNYEIVHSD